MRNIIALGLILLPLSVFAIDRYECVVGITCPFVVPGGKSVHIDLRGIRAGATHTCSFTLYGRNTKKIVVKNISTSNAAVLARMSDPANPAQSPLEINARSAPASLKHHVYFDMYSFRYVWQANAVNVICK